MALLLNSYVDMQAFKDYYADSGTSDAPDDRVITAVLNGVSRFVDGETRGRWFYPKMQSRLFSLPNSGAGWRNYRTLRMDTDLLAVTTVTNGNGDIIDPTKYYLETPNVSPYWAITLTETGGVIWQYGPTGNREYVISVNGVWGVHDNYSAAYTTGSTLAAAITTTTATTFTVATGQGVNFANGMILRIDSEWLACDSVATDTLTVRRGINGSTAATHLINSAVEIFHPLQDIAEACKMIALSVYRRFGQRTGTGGDVTITGAGVVVTPKDVSGIARATLDLWNSRKLLIQY